MKIWVLFPLKVFTKIFDHLCHIKDPKIVAFLRAIWKVIQNLKTDYYHLEVNE